MELCKPGSRTEYFKLNDTKRVVGINLLESCVLLSSRLAGLGHVHLSYSSHVSSVREAGARSIRERSSSSVCYCWT